MQVLRRRAALFLLTVAPLASAACSHKRGGGVGTGDGGIVDGMPPSQVTQVVIAPGTPSDAPNQFSGNNQPSATPTLVYPPDGVIMPPNISELEVQWNPGAGTSVYELRFVSTYLDLSIYTVCNAIGSGCGYQPDQATWQLMAKQARGDTMTLTLRASNGVGVGSAPPQKLSFTNEDLLGGLYYWAAAAGQIVRYDFGQVGQNAETFYSQAEAGAICVGCHALARNGQRIAVGLNIPAPAGMRVLDVATKSAKFDAMGGSNFEAFSPDASRILVNAGADLLLLDAATGMQVGSAAAITNGNLADWSADGAKVVFSRQAANACPIPAFCGGVPGVTSADLYTVDVSGDHFGSPSMLVTGGGNNFYPTFSPDGALVAFNRSASNTNSFDCPDSRVWVVSATGGAPVQLTNAATTGPNAALTGDSWPKFAPFSHTFKGETIFWLTFSSRRDYGLRIINSTITPMMNSDGSTDDARIAQIWMVGVPASVVMGGPNSTPAPAGGYPAFWLPFQSMKSGNHIAQWTESVARQPCGGIDGVPCPTGEDCQNGVCVGVPIL
jgi:TolB protein